jgi:hypothetical protein
MMVRIEHGVENCQTETCPSNIQFLNEEGAFLESFFKIRQLGLGFRHERKDFYPGFSHRWFESLRVKEAMKEAMIEKGHSEEVIDGLIGQ